MPSPIKLLDVVALTVNFPADNLWRGQVGTLVEVLAGENAFEVEFSDREGPLTSRSGCGLSSSSCYTMTR
jgi:Domain of unknown function (DUF4926)